MHTKATETSRCKSRLGDIFSSFVKSKSHLIFQSGLWGSLPRCEVFSPRKSVLWKKTNFATENLMIQLRLCFLPPLSFSLVISHCHRNHDKEQRAAFASTHTMPDAFFQKKRKRTTASSTPSKRAGPSRTKSSSSSSRKGKHAESSDDDDLPGGGIDDMDLTHTYDQAPNSDDEAQAAETPAEARVRLAKMYLEGLSSSAGGQGGGGGGDDFSNPTKHPVSAWQMRLRRIGTI